MASSLEFEYYLFWSGLTQTVRFYARHGDRRIRCAVTRMALEERAGALQPLRPTGLERVFEQHRQEIERIAGTSLPRRRHDHDPSGRSQSMTTSPRGPRLPYPICGTSSRNARGGEARASRV